MALLQKEVTERLMTMMKEGGTEEAKK